MRPPTTAATRSRYVKMGASRDGRFAGLHVRIIADMGAYAMFLGPLIPSLGAFVMPGCYRWDAVRTDITGVYTNKMGTDAIRGAGRPEATHYIEVMVDQMAAELGIDSLELRRRNFIPKEEFPYDTPVGMTYDSGDYQGDAGEAPGARRPGAGARAHGGRQAARHRVLDVDGDLRPRPVARHRPGDARRPGRAVGVRAGARPGHGQRDRLHGHVAARPGARDRVRADRGRPARGSTPSRSTSCTATPRRARRASARTARARSRWAARRSSGRRRRWSPRRARSSPTSSRPRRRTSSCATGSSP